MEIWLVESFKQCMHQNESDKISEIFTEDKKSTNFSETVLYTSIL